VYDHRTVPAASPASPADRPSSRPARVRLGTSETSNADEAELREAIARTRTIVGVGLSLWLVGGFSDLFVGASGQAPVAWLLSIRAAYGLVVLAVWLRLRSAPPPSERSFDLLCRLTYIGAAFALGGYAVLWRGLESPAGHGVSAVLCVQALGRPLPLRRGLLAMGLTALGYPTALLVGAAFETTVAAQLAEPSALSTLAFQVVLTVATAGLLAVGGDVTWSLKRRLHQARVVGRYRLDTRIGQGGMGEVWRAYHPALRKHVAVKILKAELASGAGLTRFDREIEAMTELEHPNTVRVFDAGVTDDGLYYYAMELLDGETLLDLVESDGPLAPARAVNLVRQAARAIGEAHQKGLVHRDIKPENLFVATLGGERDFMKVLDFGIAKIVDEARSATLTREGIVVGTPAYMSPEQALGRSTDARSDVYALGAVFFFALTGHAPFEDDSVVAVLTAHVHETPRLVSSLLSYTLEPPERMKQLDDLLSRALAKSPSDRFATMAELEAALADLGDLEVRRTGRPPPRVKTIPFAETVPGLTAKGVTPGGTSE
jgi:eukaryotic-like serine/threonine-protein kinase